MKRPTLWFWRIVKSFGLFWWDFLVGDTPEITVVVVLSVVVVALARDVAHSNALAYVALPILVTAGLLFSVLRARRRLKT
jgi:hypothetical protein